jgi:2-keto-3-deoxy-L-rhamnonate aldolase RhmA
MEFWVFILYRGRAGRNGPNTRCELVILFSPFRTGKEGSHEVPGNRACCAPGGRDSLPARTGATDRKSSPVQHHQTKTAEGKQVFSYTQTKFDIAGNCEAAKHYDYTGYEMQHSTLEFKDIEAMIAACPHAGATPLIRLPDAQEWHIQHATDIGVLGVIVPTVDDVDRAREAAKWVRYPPVARRSTGGGQAAGTWGINGIDYHASINDNMLLVIMIETPTGMANAYDIASVPGVDVVIIGNNDLSYFLRLSAERRSLPATGKEGPRRRAAPPSVWCKEKDSLMTQELLW